jgi:hypothetical protein
LVLANQKTCSPSLFELITLITYLFSFLLFACLACHRAGLCSPTVALTLYPTRCVGLSTYVILSFLLFFVLCTDRFSFLVLETDRKKFLPPPRVLSPSVSFFTFYPTLHHHLPDFLQPACLFSACLLLLRVSLCPCGTARVSLFV